MLPREEGDTSHQSIGEGNERAEHTTLSLSRLPTNTRRLEGEDLGPREQKTYSELLHLDERLADIFLTGHQLVEQAGRAPGAVYMLAHAGRELSRGVVRALLSGEAAEALLESEEPPDTEQNRLTIGQMLHRPPMHQSVSEWFRLNQTFSKSCHLHVHVAPPSAEQVVQAFSTFSELLYGRVAPYFVTAGELDSLLEIAVPTAQDVVRAEALLLRDQLRRHFFARLSHPGWIGPLAQRGHFAHPPERLVHADGSWQMRSWYEGEYLVRVAERAPEEVFERLQLVPVTNLNPAVWSVVADAALVLPVALASRFAARIAKVLRTVPPVLLAHKAVDLVGRLAVARDDSAWKLADSLLWCRAVTDAPVIAEDRLSGWRAAAVAMFRIDSYELSRFRQAPLSALATLDGARALKLLASRLDHVLHFARACGRKEEQIDQGSQWWCESLDDSHDEDIRVQLAISTAHLACLLARSGPEQAAVVWSVLERRSGDIFERIKLKVLTHSGEYLQDELDAVIGSEILLEPPYGGREAIELLRSRFRDASPSARTLFRYGLERGPSAGEVQAHLEYRRRYGAPRGEETGSTMPAGAAVPGGDESTHDLDAPSDPPVTATEVEAVVKAWQTRRLRWFHDAVPAELSDLAERLEVLPQVPTPRQQALDERGWFSSGVSSWGGPASPRSADELARLSSSELLRLLEDWRPEGDASSGLAYHGLESALSDFVATQPDRGVELLRLAVAVSIRPGYIVALLFGLRSAAMTGRDIPWMTALAAAEEVVQAADKATVPDLEAEGEGGHAVAAVSVESTGWDLAMRAVASLVRIGCAKDRPPRTCSTEVWSLVTTLARSSTLQAERVPGAHGSGLGRILTDALNSTRGETTRALIDAGLWEYRAHQSSQPGAPSESPHIPAVESLVGPLLSELLTHPREAVRHSEVVLGELTPQVMLLAPAWFESAEERLFMFGMEQPLEHPAWSAYLLRSRVYDPTFTHLRPWYVRAARALPETQKSFEGADTRSSTQLEWSTTRSMASHVMAAIIAGLAAVEDEDALVNITFSRVPAHELAHVYWQVFRDWSNPLPRPSDESAERVLQFWEWRVCELESGDSSPGTAQEAEGLVWLLRVPHLPTIAAIRLGHRTLKLCPSSTRLSMGVWGRLRTLAESDATGTFDLVDEVVNRELASAYVYLPFDEVAPVLRAALTCEDARVRQGAARLVHRIGEVSGNAEYGSLFRSSGGR